MAYEDLSGGISEHEAGEEFMQKLDEQRRDEEQFDAEAMLLAVLESRAAGRSPSRAAVFVCEVLSDSRDIAWNPFGPHEERVYMAAEMLGVLEVLRIVGKWAQEQQKAKGSAA